MHTDYVEVVSGPHRHARPPTHAKQCSYWLVNERKVLPRSSAGVKWNYRRSDSVASTTTMAWPFSLALRTASASCCGSHYCDLSTCAKVRLAVHASSRSSFITTCSVAFECVIVSLPVWNENKKNKKTLRTS